MSEEWLNFVKDPRTTCKYGAQCYQKNPDHHNKYKHPPHQNKLKNEKNKNKRMEPYPQNKRKIIKESKDYGATSSIKHIDTAPETNDVEKQDTKVIESSDVNNIQSGKDNILVPIKDTSQFYEKTEDNTLYKELFFVEMPLDFFQFYKCLSEEKSVEQTLASVNLQLIGPYDLLMGKLPIVDQKDLYLIHWRFFYNPPEFQPVLKKKGKSEFHIGYYRDDPGSMPAFLGSSDSAKDYVINPVADNIFGAVYLFLQNEKKSSPFLAMPCQKVMEKVKNWANEYNYSLDEYIMKKRTPQIVARTLHGAGIVVPFNKKTQLGYRPLVESNANLKKMFAKLESATSQSEKDVILSEMQPVITYASIAVDECDFGTGLEVGIDLFCSGLKELEASAASSLCSVYSLLCREPFSKILQVHLKHRRRGPNMSIFM